MPQPAAPRARILSIGDELILGRTVDTNATFLARLASDAGFEVVGMAQTGDALGGLVTALEQAIEGAELVLVSGGLGPTDDDRTREALASVLGCPLVEDAAAWTAIAARWQAVLPDKPMPASNRRQAQRPAAARILPNDRGTAPGLVATPVRQGRKVVIAVFPGVPHEMTAMATRFAATLRRRFPALTPPEVGEIWFAGISESLAQERIGDLMAPANPQVGITVSTAGHLTLRVVGTPIAVRRRLSRLRACVRPWLLPEAGLAPSLVMRLAWRKATISAAESCTGGRVAAMITAVPGASAVLRSSLVAYHPEAKRDLLGVSPEILADGVVSEACARAMAEGQRRVSGATYAIATTGIAGPDGGSETIPVGTVWLAVAGPRGTATRRINAQGDRERIQNRAAAAALMLAWEVQAGARLAP